MAVIRTFGIYELDSGNSFNGQYIPHELETNWYYGPVPAQFMQVQGVRLHGLSKGSAELGMAIKGAQNDMYFDGDTYSTSAVPVSLPKVATSISSILHATTHRADIVGRGLAVQIKIFGTGDEDSDPEPPHVCQALTIFSSQEGAYDH